MRSHLNECHRLYEQGLLSLVLGHVLKLVLLPYLEFGYLEDYAGKFAMVILSSKSLTVFGGQSGTAL